MKLLDRFRTPSTELDLVESTELVPFAGNTPAQYEATIEFLEERFAELELQLEDWNWTRMVAEGDREFTREGLDRIIALSRIMFIKNPLIGRAVRVKNFYLWGQGVEITARDDTINDMVKAFLEDRGNKRAVFGHEARKLCEQTLETEGNLFVSCFPNRMTGMLSVRTIPVDEIREVITNPDDRTEPWFYHRVWVEVRFNWRTGLNDMTKMREAYYPDWQYQPSFRPPEMAGHPVLWDTQVYHVKVGGLQTMRFGVPETYAAIDWARAYKNFLTDFAGLANSLSRLAWEMTSKRNSAKGNAARLTTTVDPGAGTSEQNPSPVTGAVFSGGPGVEMKPINKSGALIDASQGKELRLQVGAAMDLPDTILSGDPDQGNLATAKTLDRPTELAMIDRQTLWANIFEDLIDHMIDWSVKAPANPLTGRITRTGSTTVIVELDDETDRTIEVVFPPILEDDLQELSTAITAAKVTGYMPPETTLSLFLAALGVDDADEIIENAKLLGLLEPPPDPLEMMKLAAANNAAQGTPPTGNPEPVPA